MRVRIGSAESFLAAIVAGACDIAACALDKDDLIANHTLVFIQGVRERGFFVKDV
jgi:hypothetical protein